MASETGVLRFSIEFDDKGTVKIKNAKGEVVKLEKQTKKSTSAMGKQFGGLWKQIVGGQIAFNLLRGAVRTLGRALKGAFTDAIDFEKELANVSTLVDTSVVSMDQMGEGILDLAGELGSAQELTKGLYQALSAGVDPAKGIDFVAEAAKFAKAGLTDMFSAVDAITTAINAYGLEVSDAGNVSDIFFETIKKGKITGQQLAGSIGLIISTAAQMDISLKEVSAAIASMTKVGIPAERAMISLNQTMMAALKPTEGAMKVAKQYGIELSRAGIQGAGGFQKWLEKLKKAVGDNERAMAEMFPNVRALRAVFSLTGKAAGEYKDILEGMADVAGNTDEAFKKQAATFGAVAETIKNEMSAAITKVLLPVLQDLAKWLKENKDSIITFATIVINVLGGVIKAFGFLGAAAKKAFEIIDDYIVIISPALKIALNGWKKLLIVFSGELERVYKDVIDSTASLAQTQKKVFDRMVDLKKATGLTNEEWVKLISNYEHIKDPVNRYNQMMIDFKKGKYDKEFKNLSEAVKDQTEIFKKAEDPIKKVAKALKAGADAANELRFYFTDLVKPVDNYFTAVDLGTKRLIANTLAAGDNQIAAEMLIDEMLRGEEIAEEYGDALWDISRIATALSDILSDNLIRAIQGANDALQSFISGDIVGGFAGFIGTLDFEDPFGVQGRIDKILQERQDQIDEMERQQAEMRDSARTGIDAFSRFVKGGINNVESFNAVMNITLMSFAELVKQGKSLPEIFGILGDQFDVLEQTMENLGIEGNETFNKLLKFRNLVKDNKDLVDSVGALNDAMVGFAGGGMIQTQTAFDDFQKLATNSFDKLIDAGFSQNEALLLMIPTLRTLRDLQADYGFEIDENIQKQIDLADEKGLLDQVDPLQQIIDLLQLIADQLSQTIPGALSDMVNASNNAWKSMADGAIEAGKSIDQAFKQGIIPLAPTLPKSPGIPGFSNGAHFTIPSGFEDDSFLMTGKTGEDVQITPPGRGGDTQNSISFGDINLIFKGDIDSDTGQKLADDFEDAVVEILENNRGGARRIVREISNE